MYSGLVNNNIEVYFENIDFYLVLYKSNIKRKMLFKAKTTPTNILRHKLHVFHSSTI